MIHYPFFLGDVYQCLFNKGLYFVIITQNAEVYAHFGINFHRFHG